MATILNKDLVRETTVEINDVPLAVTLKADQSVSLKLKGTRGAGLNITIPDLWEYLGGETEKGSTGGVVAIKKSAPKKGDNKMISLYDLRSANAISGLDYATMCKFDEIIGEMIKNLGL